MPEPKRAEPTQLAHPPTQASDTYQPPQHEEELRKLLGNHTNEIAVAWIVASYPIYELEFAEYLQQAHGNSYAGRVMEMVDALRQANAAHPTPELTDHSAGVKSRGWLANDEVETAVDNLAPDPKDALPYDGRGGWDAVLINSRLGQVDRIKNTNSDGDRCAFATALAAQIFVGPGGVASWTESYVEHQLGTDTPSPRAAAAKAVIDAVRGAIVAGTATYGDLSWMQEALHDLVLARDHAGTKSSFEVVSPDVEDYTEVAEKDCTTDAQVRRAATALQPGERMMVEWHATRKLGGEIAHQLMLYNDAGVTYLYDPQPSASGLHLHTLDTAGLSDYFGNGEYSKSVLTMAGKVTPKPPATK